MSTSSKKRSLLESYADDGNDLLASPAASQRPRLSAAVRSSGRPSLMEMMALEDDEELAVHMLTDQSLVTPGSRAPSLPSARAGE